MERRDYWALTRSIEGEEVDGYSLHFCFTTTRQVATEDHTSRCALGGLKVIAFPSAPPKSLG
jgi:hypothetical protein